MESLTQFQNFVDQKDVMWPTPNNQNFKKAPTQYETGWIRMIKNNKQKKVDPLRETNIIIITLMEKAEIASGC